MVDAMKYTKDDVPAALASEATRVQDACNLCGVAQSFARAMIALHDLPQCKGTEWLNNHPVTVLYVDKLASLSGIQNSGSPVYEAYETCQNVLDGAFDVA